MKYKTIKCPFCEEHHAHITYEESRVYQLNCTECHNAIFHQDKDLFPCLCAIPHKRAKNGVWVTKMWYTGEGFIDGDSVYWSEVTHWMPLPEPPKGE